MIPTLRSFWNKVVATLRADVSRPPASVRAPLRPTPIQSAIAGSSLEGLPAGLVPAPSHAGNGLASELHRLAMRWRASARWPAQTTAHIARSLGQYVCLQGLERVLWQMGRHSPHPATQHGRFVSPGACGTAARDFLPGREGTNSTIRARNALNPEVLDIVRFRLRQEQAAQAWCEAFFRAQFPDLSREELDQTGLLDCLDEKLIGAGAFAAATYLPGDCRDVPADEVMLDGTSIFEEPSAYAAIFEREDALWSTQTVRGLARQMLARIRRDTERSAHEYGSAAKALLRIGPVVRSMDALRVETDSVYRRRSQSFLSTAQGERLVGVLPLARNLPDVIAARVDDLSNASSRIHALQWAGQSSDPLTLKLTEAGQASVLLGVRRSAWDAACRLLLFPEAVVAGSGIIGSQHLASMAGHDADSNFDMSLTPEQQRQRTHTFAQDQALLDSQDQIHGSIAGYALSRLAPLMPPGTAAGLTQRWCRAWADLMTVCGACPRSLG